MRVSAMARRILAQLIHDKRTMALILLAPLLLLSLIYFILNGSAYAPAVGIVNAPAAYVEALYENDVTVIRCSESQALQLLESEDIIGFASLVDGKLYVDIDGTDKSLATQTISLLEKGKMSYMGGSAARTDTLSEINYVYGAEDLEMFDNFGSAMIGILIFFFVFLISGISFLQERTSGTLERLLSTPIRRWEIVAGYTLGFGAVTVVQSMLVTLYAVYVLKVMMVGSIFLVLLFAMLSAMTALTFGLLASTAANNEFQIIQFIPLVLIPQIFFSGLFALSGVWEYIGYAMPLYYVAHALTEIMIRGGGFGDVMLDFFVLTGFCSVFMVVNALLLKKHRRI